MIYINKEVTMKIVIVLPVLLMSLTVFAQDRYGMNDPETQKMLEEMQKYQVCITNIDQSLFGDIEQRQMQFEKEVRALCANGKRNEAQEQAVRFGMEMTSHPAIKQIRECNELVKSEMAKEDLPDMEFDFEETDMHVCDEM